MLLLKLSLDVVFFFFFFFFLLHHTWSITWIHLHGLVARAHALLLGRRRWRRTEMAQEWVMRSKCCISPQQNSDEPGPQAETTSSQNCDVGFGSFVARRRTIVLLLGSWTITLIYRDSKHSEQSEGPGDKCCMMRIILIISGANHDKKWLHGLHVI